MRNGGRNDEMNFAQERTETLLLMAVLGQGAMKEAALGELRRRKALVDHDAFDAAFATNLSGIC